MTLDYTFAIRGVQFKLIINYLCEQKMKHKIFLINIKFWRLVFHAFSVVQHRLTNLVGTWK
ncbi:MAG: hypothetical protein ACJAT8_002424 [Cellvibrionaceae bacterium]|jgi:hypothetical protein